MNEINRDDKNGNEKKSSSKNSQKPNPNPSHIQHNPYIHIDNEITTSDPFFMFNSKQEL